MTKKSLVAKACLVFVGIILALLLVEAGLRCGGIILSTAWRLKQRHDVPLEGSYRILCLGESTTALQWPPFLQEELDKANTGITFKVIDGGLSGTYTGAILSSLDNRLDEFRPQMVVTMMGINDNDWIWKNPPEYEDKASIKLILFVKETRINKLATYIADGLKTRWQISVLSVGPNSGDAADIAQKYLAAGQIMRKKGDYEKAAQLLNSAMKADPRRQETYDLLRAVYRDSGNLEKEEAVLKAGTNNTSADGAQWFYAELIDFYARTGRIKEAENIFAQATKNYPANAEFYFRMGGIYSHRLELDKAEKSYASAIKKDPLNPQYYISLGWFYRTYGNVAKAESTFQTGIKAVPDDASLHMALAGLYSELGKFAQSEAAYKATIKIRPEAFGPYLELGQLYYNHQKYKNAADALNAAIKINSADPWAHFELGTTYRAMGENEKAADIQSQGYALMDRHWGGEHGQQMWAYPSMATVRNYRKLKNRVLERNIKIICMQYPMRSAEALMQMLGNDDRVLYVENVKNFSEALKTRPPTDIFADLFAGDFGHCTPMGNHLIGKNVAEVILRDVFNKK